MLWVHDVSMGTRAHTHTHVQWPDLLCLLLSASVLSWSTALQWKGMVFIKWNEEEAELIEKELKMNWSQEVGDLCAHVSQRLHSQMPWLLVTRLLFPLLVVTTGIDGLTRWLLTSRCRDPVSVTVSPSRGSPCPLQCCCRWAGGGV